VTYFTAYSEAQQEAAAAGSSSKDGGYAEIRAMSPNYPPGQLLYAYAIENVLKGLIIANRPRLVEERELNAELKTHDLIALAQNARDGAGGGGVIYGTNGTRGTGGQIGP
jgi:hypothetical protein